MIINQKDTDNRLKFNLSYDSGEVTFVSIFGLSQMKIHFNLYIHNFCFHISDIEN